MVGIEFNSSNRATLGVEWEVLIVDSQSRHLRQEAERLLAELKDLSQAPVHPPLRHELMQCTIEVVTGICETVSEVKADLASTIGRLRQVTENNSATLLCAGTHPMDDWRDQTLAPVQRYGELIEELQWLARRAFTFGVHVHVGVRSAEKAIPIVNALANYMPHMLALTASSPYWNGHDTGLASSRSIVFGALPTAGPPPRLANWAEFESYMATLLRAGAINSIKEVWWDIRPHPDFGTIEVRVFDGIPTLREVGMATALTQCLVQLFDQQLDRGYSLPSPAPWVVKDNKWRATRYGLDARIITDDHGSTVPLRDDLYELLRELEPVARRLGCVEDLNVVSQLLAQGASYERQRAVVDQGGTLNDVVDVLTEEMRADAFWPDFAADNRDPMTGVPPQGPLPGDSAPNDSPIDKGASHAGT